MTTIRGSRRRWLSGATVAVLTASLLIGAGAAQAAPSPTPDPTPPAVQTPTPTPTVEPAPEPEPTPEPTVEPAPTPEPTVEPAPLPAPAPDKRTQQQLSEQDAAARIRVVALGDSFASGEGAGSYDAATAKSDINECHRSYLSWQRNVTIPGIGKVTDASKVQLVHAACSGAVTADVISRSKWGEARQLDRLNGSEKVVLLSIGGNDTGFANIITSCILLPVLDCLPPEAIAGWAKQLRDVDIPAIANTVVQIAKRSPRAKIVLVGYPQLMQQIAGTSGCRGISDAESAGIDGMALTLRRATAAMVMKQRAVGYNVQYVDTIDEFKGHGACRDADARWINSPLRDKTQKVEMMHPNWRGYTYGYTTAVNAQLVSPRGSCLASKFCSYRFSGETVVVDANQSGTVMRIVKGAINSKYQQEHGLSGWLGAPTGNERCGLRDGGCKQYFAGGAIYWSSATGAIAVRGKMLTKFKQLGEEGGTLRYPTGDRQDTTGGLGLVQRFQNGIVFLKDGDDKAFYEWGEIRKAHAAAGPGGLGYTNAGAYLGFPRGDAVQTYEGNGYVQTFEKGRIYWKKGASAAYYVLTGPINDAYYNAKKDGRGHSSGILGFPVANQRFVADNAGIVQSFEKGKIFRKKGATTAYFTAGVFEANYKASGHTDGKLGFPRSNATSIDGGKYQLFDEGRIYQQSGAERAFRVHAPLLDKYLVGGSSGYGFPTSNTNCGLRNGACAQTFRTPAVLRYIVKSDWGTHWIVDDFAEAYKRSGAQDGVAGFPTGKSYREGADLVQDFTGGQMRLGPGYSQVLLCDYRVDRTCRGI
jgi:uncharacterized protein with LGFP repeats